MTTVGTDALNRASGLHASAIPSGALAVFLVRVATLLLVTMVGSLGALLGGVGVSVDYGEGA